MFEQVIEGLQDLLSNGMWQHFLNSLESLSRGGQQVFCDFQYPFRADLTAAVSLGDRGLI